MDETKTQHPIGTEKFFNCGYCNKMLSPYSIGNHLKSRQHLKFVELKKEIVVLQKKNLALEQNKLEIEKKLWEIENAK